MNKLTAGQYYYVSDRSEDEALSRKLKRFFIGYNENGDKIFSPHTSDTGFVLWQYAVPIPEKKPNPWTLETFPMEAVWVREKGTQVRELIISVGGNGVNTEDDCYSFHDLTENYERITNDSILPCGVYDENN